MSTELVKAEKSATLAPLGDIAELQKWARIYNASSLLPASWRKGQEQERIANLILVMQRANALKCDPLLLLQNLDFIAGRMCWKSTFLLQLLLANGWQAPRYDIEGDPNSADFWAKDSNGATFSAVNPATGERETGSKITVKMVMGERWLDREGSKWRTMPEQMLKYRAVAFFCRSNAPAVMGGFYSDDEVRDIVAKEKAEKEEKQTYSGPVSVDYKHPEPVPEPDPETVRRARDWANSPSNPGGNCYHD